MNLKDHSIILLKTNICFILVIFLLFLTSQIDNFKESKENIRLEERFSNSSNITLKSLDKNKDSEINYNQKEYENSQIELIKLKRNEIIEKRKSNLLNTLSEEEDKNIGENINNKLSTDRNNELYLNRNTNKPIILDVDMCTDVDDLCAVRVATALDDAGIIDLKAFTTCINGNQNLEAMRGIMAHDGKQDVLLGTASNPIGSDSPYWEFLLPYNDGMVNEVRDTAVRQMRKVLSSSSDKVDIVTTGFVTNIEALLKSTPDDISPLDGLTLVKEKAGQLYVVGGSYPNGLDNNFFIDRKAIDSIDYVSKNWPFPIAFSLAQTGGKLLCGKVLCDYDTSRKDPVSKALDSMGFSWGRAAWDPFGVWACALALNEETQTNVKRMDFGINLDNGSNWFTDNENGKHYGIFLNHTDYSYWNNKLDELCIKKHKSIYG